MSGDATQPGDSGGCVYYKTGAGINCIVGCITSCNRNTLKVCFTPIVHMEEEGFYFN